MGEWAEFPLPSLLACLPHRAHPCDQSFPRHALLRPQPSLTTRARSPVGLAASLPCGPSASVVSFKSESKIAPGRCEPPPGIAGSLSGRASIDSPSPLEYKRGTP
jgi:hypothetical protein